MAGLAGVAPHIHDRNRGQGLPSTVSDDAFHRMAAAVARRQGQAVRQDRRAVGLACPKSLAYVTADEMAETFEGISRETYAELWKVVSDVERVGLPPQGEWPEPDSPDRAPLLMPAVWSKLSEAAKQNIVEVAQADAPYRTGQAVGEPEVAEPATVGRRFASVADVERAGFKRVAAGFYRQTMAEAGLEKAAHPIWELRGAEDGEGYLLIRRREERAVDLHQTAGAGTAAAVSAGIIRQAAAKHAAQTFLVSLLQTPGGSVQDRKTIFANEAMDLDALTRLVSELKLGPSTLTHDTWSDGEWELRVRGPKGQLIHEYDSVGPDEIGGAKGQALLDTLSGVIPNAATDLGGLPPEAGATLGMEDILPATEEPMPEAAAPPAPAPAPEPVPAPAPLAPTSAALRRGQRILVLAQGGVADAVVVMVHPQQQALEVMFGDGETGSVAMDDVLDLDPPMEGELDDGALVEITADDVPADLGGTGQDPFEVEPGEDYFRAATRYLTARLHVNAVEFMGTFRPGAVIEARHDFTSFYQRLNVPEGVELLVEGYHKPDQDVHLRTQGLPNPVPGGSPFDNLRIRLRTPDGHTVLITADELEQHFDFARGGDPGSKLPGERMDEERYEELPSAPMGEVDPYAETVLAPQPSRAKTVRTRPRL